MVANEDSSYAETAKSLLGPADPNNTEVESHSQRENIDLVDHISTVREVPQGIANVANQDLQETIKGVVSHEVVIEQNKDVQVSRHENVVEKTNVGDSSARKSNDVHLNIRLPDGSSLQVKFSVMHTLRMVKDYVDENQTSSFGSYDLAIPYPRKVFGEQGMKYSPQLTTTFAVLF